MSHPAIINEPLRGVRKKTYSGQMLSVPIPESLRSPISSVRVAGPRSHQRAGTAGPNSALRYAEAILPQPRVMGSPLELVTAIAEDFLLILGGTLTAQLLVDAGSRLAAQSIKLDFSWASTFRVALLQGILFTLLGYSEGLYQPGTARATSKECNIVAKCVVWSTLLGLLAHTMSATALALVTLSNSLFVLAQRGWRRATQSRISSERATKNVLIVGSGVMAQRIARYLQTSTTERRTVLGFLDDCLPVGGEIRGKICDLPQLAKTEFIDEVIVVGVSEADALRAIRAAQRSELDIKMVPDLFGLIPTSTMLQKFGDTPVVTLREDRVLRLNAVIKRFVDVTLSTVVLALIAPLLAVIALAIRLDSSGPLIYSAQRVGFKGRRFRCLKFRTMSVNADAVKDNLRALNERVGASFKIENDPRITRVGRVLRRYSLDELPQLWNVLRGEMSLVGPRPHPLDDFERYRVDDLKRLEVIPGLTGLWQVTARKDPSFERNVQLDREYIDNWSLGGDLKILFKTISVVLQGSGT